jgi:hypothetical protein
VLFHAGVDYGPKKVDAIRVISTTELEIRQSKQRVKVPASKPTEPPATGHLDEEVPVDDYKV